MNNVRDGFVRVTPEPAQTPVPWPVPLKMKEFFKSVRVVWKGQNKTTSGTFKVNVKQRMPASSSDGMKGSAKPVDVTMSTPP